MVCSLYKRIFVSVLVSYLMNDMFKSLSVSDFTNNIVDRYIYGFRTTMKVQETMYKHSNTLMAG